MLSPLSKDRMRWIFMNKDYPLTFLNICVISFNSGRVANNICVTFFYCLYVMWYKIVLLILLVIVSVLSRRSTCVFDFHELMLLLVYLWVEFDCLSAFSFLSEGTNQDYYSKFGIMFLMEPSPSQALRLVISLLWVQDSTHTKASGRPWRCSKRSRACCGSSCHHHWY